MQRAGCFTLARFRVETMMLQTQSWHSHKPLPTDASGPGAGQQWPGGRGPSPGGCGPSLLCRLDPSVHASPHCCMQLEGCFTLTAVHGVSLLPDSEVKPGARPSCCRLRAGMSKCALQTFSSLPFRARDSGLARVGLRLSCKVLISDRRLVLQYYPSNE